MRIADIQVHPVQSPGRTLVIVTVHTDEGVTGIGEAGLQRRWRAIEGTVEHLRRWLVGEDPARIEYLWQRMFRGGFYPADRLIGSAVAAIDIALWDIKGQTLGVPVYELLGGRCRDYVDAFGVVAYLGGVEAEEERTLAEQVLRDAKPDDVARLAARQAGRGNKYFRLTPPTREAQFDSRWSVRTLVAQLQAVRDEVGDELELMVDLHTRLSLDESMYFCRAVEPLRMFVVEDPVRSEQIDAYRILRENTAVPLAAGEQWASKWEFRQAIENQWIDYARLDVCVAGGITEAKKIAALAETHMVKILPHNPLGPVCTAASLHLDLACDNAGPQEVLFDPTRMLPDVFQCSFTYAPQRLTLPTTPGIGVRFDAAAARRFPAEMTEPPHFHRSDGSFTNY
jgi:L-alanine-DL-glutamate epimerase-like enolase superfamily enzyme